MKYILPFVMLVFIFSCTKDQTPAVDCSAKTNKIEYIRSQLAGTYTWVYTSVWAPGNSPFTETPITTGVHYQYVFNTTGTVKYYENNVLKSNGNYVIDYEFKVSTYPLDSATIVIIKDKQTGLRREFFRPYLCRDSARFFNPYNSIDYQRFFKRN